MRFCIIIIIIILIIKNALSLKMPPPKGSDPMYYPYLLQLWEFENNGRVKKSLSIASAGYSKISRIRMLKYVIGTSDNH